MKSTRKLMFMLVAVVLVVGLLVSGCPSPTPTPTPTPTTPTATATPTPTPTPTPTATAQPITLSLNYHVPPPPFYISTSFDSWIKAVQDKSNGRIIIKSYPAESLSKAAAAYDSAVTGLADIAWFHSAHTPGRFPLHEIYDLPFLGITSAEAAGNNQYDLWQTGMLNKEFEETHVLYMMSISLFQLILTKPVKTMADLNGMRIRIPGEVASKALTQLGATPVSMPQPDIYLALEKKVMDGTIMSISGADQTKLFEVTDYVTIANLYPTTFCMVMNKNSWDKLGPDLQKVFNDVFGNRDTWTALGKTADTLDIGASAKWDTYTLPPDELAKWKDATKNLPAEYIASLKAKGIANAQEVLDFIVKTAPKYK